MFRPIGVSLCPFFATNLPSSFLSSLFSLSPLSLPLWSKSSSPYKSTPQTPPTLATNKIYTPFFPLCLCRFAASPATLNVTALSISPSGYSMCRTWPSCRFRPSRPLSSITISIPYMDNRVTKYVMVKSVIPFRVSPFSQKSRFPATLNITFSSLEDTSPQTKTT